MRVEMFKRHAIEGQLSSAVMYHYAHYYRDIGSHRRADMFAKQAAEISKATRENLFAEIGQNKIAY